MEIFQSFHWSRLGPTELAVRVRRYPDDRIGSEFQFLAVVVNRFHLEIPHQEEREKEKKMIKDVRKRKGKRLSSSSSSSSSIYSFIYSIFCFTCQICGRLVRNFSCFLSGFLIYLNI